MKYICHICKESWPSPQSLSQHRRSCNKAAAARSQVPKTTLEDSAPKERRFQRLKGVWKAKVARKEGSIAEEARSELREQLNSEYELPHAEAPAFSADEIPLAGPSNTAALDPPIVPPPPKSPPQSRSRFGRLVRKPRYFQDMVPSLRRNDTWLRSISHLYRRTPTPPPRTPTPQASGLTPEPFCDPIPTPEPEEPHDTVPDTFGVFRRYKDYPARDLDDEQSPDNHIDAPHIASNVPIDLQYHNPLLSFSRSVATKTKAWFYPFLNATVFRLVHWVYTGSTHKSHGEVNRLVREVLRAPDFRVEDLEDFDIQREERRLDKATLSEEGLRACGFKNGTVDIMMPCEKVQHTSYDDVPTFSVPDVWTRDMAAVIEAEAKSASAKNLEFNAFEQIYQDPITGDEERIFSELYNSDAMLREQEKIRALPPNPADPPNIERAVWPVAAHSDETLVANFGDASMWPIYLLFPSLSKYIVNNPNTFTVHHIGYIPSLPENFKAEYKRVHGVYPSDRIMRLCKNDLLQAVWLHLMDEKFMEAYEHGMLVKCGDGILRRLFPRFFIYSADYPERCFVRKDQIHEMGGKRDMKRRKKKRRDTPALQADLAKVRADIFLKGLPADGVMVESRLRETSLLPIRNAFSIRLLRFGFNFYSMYAEDWLHGNSAGWIKAIIVHILRLLETAGDSRTEALDDRFRNVPSFGRGTIRKFKRNVSELKKMAARDYDNILLLRLHTETTLKFMEELTTLLGDLVRKWKRKVDKIQTKELEREIEVRRRREIARAAKEGRPADPIVEKKIKMFNLTLYKWHGAGHFADDIRKFGPVEIFSTQWGEHEHKRVKKLYSLTNKNGHAGQIAMKQQRTQALEKIKTLDEEVGAVRNDEASEAEPQAKRRRGRPRKIDYFGFREDETEELPEVPWSEHHQIAANQNYKEDIHQLVHKNPEDPALQNFIPDLTDHILARLRGHAFNGEEHQFTWADRKQVRFLNNRIYRHQTMRVNYTTYDIRRDQDTINPRTRADVMVLNPGDEESENEQHPYWYARVCGIFHANVSYTGPGSTGREPQRIEFLWVRWFGLEPGSENPFKSLRLPLVGFVSEDVPGAFGFLDPAQVIRAAHIMPAEEFGLKDGLMGSALRRERPAENADWNFYHVGMFADRDMGMRYIGGGIGHKMLRGIINISDTMKMILKDLEDENMDEEEDDQDRDETQGAADPDVYTLDLGDEGEWSDDEDDGEDASSDEDE
ncbi:hypothetical protein EIP86_004942 [Pleurotus ostreatoroseus]|nr:hypothetical protein EIP86_004942 [Pleurotus ostreatoroseus]